MPNPYRTPAIIAAGILVIFVLLLSVYVDDRAIVLLAPPSLVYFMFDWSRNKRYQDKLALALEEKRKAKEAEREEADAPASETKRANRRKK